MTRKTERDFMSQLSRRKVEEYRRSLESEEGAKEFHDKNPDFCEKTIDYFEKMGHFAENAATKDDLKDVFVTLDKHEQRISSLESLKPDMKNVIDMAADFSRWKDKALKLCAFGFVIMVLKAVGIPDWLIKALIAVGGV